MAYNKPSAGAKTSLNILLLSRSGQGESTCINSFANYVTYKSPDEIHSKSDVKAPIPAKVFIQKQFTIGQENQDGNETLALTRSGTKGCREHRFQFMDLNVNFIDTPGLGDTRGAEQDKKNVAAILAHLARYESLHGICILVRADTERFDDMFKYSIKQLICQLDKTAASNVVWVYTHSRSTMYELGSGAKAIERMISSIRDDKPHLKIFCNEQNSFILDNEAFHFIVAKSEISFKECVVQNFKESWNFSRLEFRRMIEYIRTLPLYDTIASMCIHRSHQLIETVLPHLLEVTDNIIINEEECRKKEQEIKEYKGTIEGLRKILFIPRKTLTTETFKEPRILCNGCRTQVETEGVKKMHYKVCYVFPYTFKQSLFKLPVIASKAVPTLTTAYGVCQSVIKAGTAPKLAVAGGAVLGSASVAAVAYGGYWYKEGACSKCGCKNSQHCIRYYETREVDEQVQDGEVMKTIDTLKDLQKMKEFFLAKLRRELSLIQEEKKVFDQAHGLFAVFLNKKAMVPFNDPFPGYLCALIEAEQVSARTDGRKFERLENQLKEYEKLRQAIEDDVKLLDLENIESKIGRLKRLQKYGSNIETVIEMRRIAKQCLNEQTETTDEINKTFQLAMGS